MFFEMVATLVSGFAGAGVVLLLSKISGGRLPKWAMPVGAGLAMILTTIANEYAWYDRTQETLPEGMEVIQTVENKAIYRPWTYVKPFTERFIALDEPSLRTHDARPNMRMADVYFFGRWSAPEKMVMLADCAAGRRAPLIDGVSFDADGEITGVDWFAPGEGDPLVTAICNLEVS